MIDAAERLVAEQGLAALTVQAVQDAAGQRNKSAVQYHFGGRDGLVRALLAARMEEPNRRRTAMLLDLGPDATMRDLVEVIVVPLTESVLARRPSYWARFLLQALSDPATGRAALDVMADHALVVAQARLEDLLVGLPRATRTLRVRSMVGYACVVLAGYEVGVLPHALDGQLLATELVDACCGLVEAPTTAPARRILRTLRRTTKEPPWTPTRSPPTRRPSRRTPPWPADSRSATRRTSRAPPAAWSRSTPRGRSRRASPPRGTSTSTTSSGSRSRRPTRSTPACGARPGSTASTGCSRSPTGCGRCAATTSPTSPSSPATPGGS